MQTRFILINTSHAGNVGAAARAMKTMGFDDLVLVAPRWKNVLRREETIQRASGALDVLDSNGKVFGQYLSASWSAGLEMVLGTVGGDPFVLYFGVVGDSVARAGTSKHGKGATIFFFLNKHVQYTFHSSI